MKKTTLIFPMGFSLTDKTSLYDNSNEELVVEIVDSSWSFEGSNENQHQRY